MQKTLTFDQFSGGMAAGESKQAPTFSAQLLQQLNIHEDSSYITLQPKTSKISGSVVTDFPDVITGQNPWDTNLYAYGATGKIYKIDSSNNVTLDHTISGDSPSAQGMFVFNNALWYASSTQIGQKGPFLNNSPTYNDNYLGSTFWQNDPVLQSGGTGHTYTLLNAITQNATNRIQFIADRDPLEQLVFLLDGTGSGNWICTITDLLGNTIGTQTVLNGNLVTHNNYQYFIFSQPLRLTIGNTYYIYLTSTTGNGTVVTGTSSDFSTATLFGYFSTLIADTQYHPMGQIGSKLVIGNNQYLAALDAILNTYNPNAIQIDAGYRVRTLHKEDTYIVATAYKGTNILNSQGGRIYYWDGIQPSFNYAYDIPDGPVHMATNFKNRTFTIQGNRGTMYMGVEPYQKVYTMDNNLARNKTLTVDPTSTAIYKGRLLYGLGNTATDPTFPTGVWGFGNSSDQLPEVLSFDFIISTGNSNNLVAIGGLSSIGSNLYIGWYDANTGTYGIDVTTPTNNASLLGKMESMIIDVGNPNKQSLWLTLVISFVPLNSGESVQPFYTLERDGSVVNGTTVNTVGAMRAELPINARSREASVGFMLGSTNGTYPQITGFEIEVNDLAEETDKS